MDTEEDISSYQQKQDPNVLTQEYKRIEFKSNILSLAWKPKNPNEKNKFVVYTND